MARKPAKTPLSGADEEFRKAAGARLGELLSLYDSRPAAVAIAGKSEDMLADYVAGRAKVPLEVLVRLSEPKDVSVDWLATGRGPMRRTDPLAQRAMERAYGISDGMAEAQPAYQPEGFYLVPVYNVAASSGHGAFATVDEPIEPLAFPHALLRRLASQSFEKLVVVFNRGESNEPDIYDGDAMLVDRGIERLLDDAFYVFSFDGALMVKLIERMLDGRVALKSRNPGYREEILSRDEAGRLSIFGRVVWRGGLV